MAPAGTPRAVVDKLNRQINTSLADAAFRKRVMDMGVTPMGGTPDEVTGYIGSEANRWGDLVRSLGLKMG